MKNSLFMRLIILFDLPVETNHGKAVYRKFVKFLDENGYMRLQYSVYSKLCINADSAATASKSLKNNSPSEGDIRYFVITENQYQSIVNVNDKYSLQEKITTTNRVLMIGGMNNENKDG